MGLCRQKNDSRQEALVMLVSVLYERSVYCMISSHMAHATLYRQWSLAIYIYIMLGSHNLSAWSESECLEVMSY